MSTHMDGLLHYKDFKDISKFD
jgi:hypothetical protein